MSEAFWLAMFSNAVVAALLGGLGWLLNVRRPAVAHALFALALLKLMTPPLFAVQVPFAGLQSGAEFVHSEGRLTFEPPSSQQPPATPSERISAATSTPTSIAADRRAEPEQTPYTEAIAPAMPVASSWRMEQTCMTLWALGSLAVLFVLIRRGLQLGQLVAQTIPADPATIAEIEQARSAIGLRQLPQVRMVGAAIPPMVALHRFRPTLVVPDARLPQLPETARVAIFTHELAHIARGDVWLRLFESLACVLLWWHPLRWLLQRALRDAEERACDAWATSQASTAERRSYCDALLAHATTAAPPFTCLASPATRRAAPSLSPHQQRAWKRRLENVMTNAQPARTGMLSRAAIAIAAVFLLPFAIAQQPKPAPESLLKRLEHIEVAINFDEAPLGEWADFLAHSCKLNIVIQQSANDADANRTTLRGLKLPKTNARRVLEVIRVLTDLHWQCEGGILFISAQPIVNEVPPKQDATIRLHGAVNEPGVQTLPSNTTLLDLLAKTMTTQDADLGAVRIVRMNGKASTTLTIDVDGMLRNGTTDKNVLLQPGDIITILEKMPADLPPLTLRPGSSVRFVLDDIPAGHEEMLLLLEEAQRVQRDGTIFVPLVGNVYVTGKDRDQTAQLVMAVLQPILAGPPKVWARFD